MAQTPHSGIDGRNKAFLKIIFNKKVLLRERKRHTARHVASTHCATLSNPDLIQGGDPVPGLGGNGPRSEGGYLVPGLGGPGPGPEGGVTWSQVWGGCPVPGLGGYPIQGLGGCPVPGLGGYPIPGQGGYPIQTWSGGYSGYPPYLDLGWGTPLPGPGMGYPPLPRPGIGCPPLPGPGMGYPPYLDLRWGTPLPRPEMGYPSPHKCGQTENIASHHPSDAGGNE